jgi:hypothetical protein
MEDALICNMIECFGFNRMDISEYPTIYFNKSNYRIIIDYSENTCTAYYNMKEIFSMKCIEYNEIEKYLMSLFKINI